MKVIGQKLWNEPAVFIGLLVSLGLLVVNLLGDPSWSVQEVVEILAPLISGLGIRPLVTPVKGQTTGTTYQSPPKVAA